MSFKKNHKTNIKTANDIISSKFNQEFIYVKYKR